MTTKTIKLSNPTLTKITQSTQKVDYWKMAIVIIATMILIGFSLGMISGLATIILNAVIGIIFIAKPIKDLFQLDFSIHELELKNLHEELWH